MKPAALLKSETCASGWLNSKLGLEHDGDEATETWVPVGDIQCE
jgi:hypothetical protein